MAGDVDEGDRLPQDLGPEAEELVHHAGDGPLVARNDARGEDGEVALRDLDILVLLRRHQGERGVGLPLAPGGEDDLPVAGQPGQGLERHHAPLGDAEVAELRGQADVRLHAPAEQGDLPAEPVGEVEDLLDPVDVGGEGGEDDAARGSAEALGERSADLALGRRRARPVDVRGVGHEAEHPALAQLGEPVVVGALAVDRARVELEVARVDEGPDRRPDPVAEPVDDGVGHADGLDVEGAQLERSPRLDRVEPRPL